MIASRGSTKGDRLQSVDTAMRVVVLELLVLWAETKDEKYNQAADLVVNAIDTMHREVKGNGGHNRKGEGV